jgi:hypothetical protein
MPSRDNFFENLVLLAFLNGSELPTILPEHTGREQTL